MSSEASAIAYHAIPNLAQRQDNVYDCIANNPDVSSNDISRITKMNKKNVRCRITELLNMGKIEISGEKIDHKTKRKIRKYRIVEKVYQ